LRPIPKKFSEVIDKLPPNSWVALTPDRKLVAGVGATEEEAAQNAELDYGLQNPILVKVPEPRKGNS
jgi:predicted RNase H-like HicB family nuclease